MLRKSFAHWICLVDRLVCVVCQCRLRSNKSLSRGVQVNETGQRRFFFERRQWSEIPAVACAHLYRAAFVDLVSLREVNPSAHAQKANLTVN